MEETMNIKKDDDTTCDLNSSIVVDDSICTSDEEPLIHTRSSSLPSRQSPSRPDSYFLSYKSREDSPAPTLLGAVPLLTDDTSLPPTPPFYSAPSSPPTGSPGTITPPKSYAPTEVSKIAAPCVTMTSLDDTSSVLQETGDDELEEYEVRRTLSLKSHRLSPSDSPDHTLKATTKKVVRFADSLGLDLEVVRMYPDWDQPPENVASAAAAAKAHLWTSGHGTESILVSTAPPSETPLPPREGEGVAAKNVPRHLASTTKDASARHHGGAGESGLVLAKKSVATSSTTDGHKSASSRARYYYRAIGPASPLPFPSLSLRIGNAMTGKYLSPTFPQPGASYDFLRRVKERKVCLEGVTVRPSKCTVSGTVVVENIAFHKTVYVRYTVDDWITYSDCLCTYVQGSTKESPLIPSNSPSASSPTFIKHHQAQPTASSPTKVVTISTDTFSFEIVVPFSLSVGSNMYLAILYRAGGREYWDSNNGANYQLKCYMAAQKSSPKVHAGPNVGTTSTSSSHHKKVPKPPDGIVPNGTATLAMQSTSAKTKVADSPADNPATDPTANAFFGGSARRNSHSAPIRPINPIEGKS